mmetsp:Transcript_28960/g.78366  ORF Transcript_28960/g.78366 Transcript_28960/m.78366 type:complete len:248 (+) Transcript_28960:246-989(+)
MPGAATRDRPLPPQAAWQPAVPLGFCGSAVALGRQVPAGTHELILAHVALGRAVGRRCPERILHEALRVLALLFAVLAGLGAGDQAARLDEDLGALALPELPLVLLRDALLDGVQGHEAPDVDLPLLTRAPDAADGLHLEGHGLLARGGLHRVHDDHVVAGGEVGAAGGLLQGEQQEPRAVFLVLELGQGGAARPDAAAERDVLDVELIESKADLALQVLPLHKADDLAGVVIPLQPLHMLHKRLNL